MRRTVSWTSSSSMAPPSGVLSASLRTPPTLRVARAVWTTAAAPRGATLRPGAPPLTRALRAAWPAARAGGAALLQPTQVGVRDKPLGMRARDDDRTDAF